MPDRKRFFIRQKSTNKIEIGNFSQKNPLLVVLQLKIFQINKDSLFRKKVRKKMNYFLMFYCLLLCEVIELTNACVAAGKTTLFEGPVDLR